MLTGLRKRLHNYFLKRELRHVHFTRVTTNINDARDIGILFPIGDSNENQLVYDFANRLKVKDRQVILLGYLDARQAMMNYTFPYFYRKDLNWYLEPVSRVALDFMERPFDILISLCSQECLPLEYVLAFSHAKFRIGPYNPEKTYCYDMMLHVPNAKGFTKLMEETVYYLQRV